MYVGRERVRDHGWLVARRRHGMNLIEKRRPAVGRLTSHLDVSDDRLAARRHVELQKGAIRIVPLGCRSRDAGNEKPMVAIELLDEPRDFLRAAGRRGRAEAADHRAPDEAARQGQRWRAAEIHRLNVVQRDEVVAQRDASGCRQRVDLDVLKSPEPVDVRDGLSHLGHRQRIADPCFDQRADRGIVYRAIFGDHFHLDDPLADERGRRRLGAQGRRDRQDKQGTKDKARASESLQPPVSVKREPAAPGWGPRRNEEVGPRSREKADNGQGGKHHNAARRHHRRCCTRKSIEKVRSPFCVRTQPSRSFWSYSSTRIWVALGVVPSGRANVT